MDTKGLSAAQLPDSGVVAADTIGQMPRPPGRSRDRNLDLLRACAIIGVVLYHVIPVLELHNPVFRLLGAIGWEGVDLFFVLSGWLIGGLYWSERLTFGDVQIPRFMLRRLIRTVPPYFVGLLLACVAVRTADPGRAHFTWRYLFFIQNYYWKLPFFSISWSLCVEEHFYLIMPTLFLLFHRPNRMTSLAFLALFIAPMCIRVVFKNYYLSHIQTDQVLQTHLRMEGLVIGVYLSYLRWLKPVAWARLKPIARILAVPALAMVCLNPYLPPMLQYLFGYTLIAVAFGMLVAALAGSPALAVARLRVVFILASWSYSIYLIHALAMLSVKRFEHHLPLRYLGLVCATFVTILFAAAAFHFAVERPSILIRDRLVPRRCTSRLRSES